MTVEERRAGDAEESVATPIDSSAIEGGSIRLTPDTDRSASRLDDFRDREELRQRYKRLLEETRVLLPGVQLFAAFLFTVPFTARFEDLERTGRIAYGISIGAAVLAVVVLVSPIAFHRISERTARSARLVWGIRATVVALVLVATALISATLCVAGFVFGTTVGVVLASCLGTALVVLWGVLPLTHRRAEARRV